MECSIKTVFIIFNKPLFRKYISLFEKDPNLLIIYFGNQCKLSF